ncbi:glycosyltransferase family A protein [Blastomonas marina]|uniref:glycosyltransferase family 2 protein n=1 Tax=Blastomonas marina TaxID=1867408 RepID=UPI002AC9862B|nr:glycosyltransferase family A protein [Blastomonas marina]WPZ05262.1 glycosyltransferase family A protein [Blastomonas marina]
MSRVLVTEMVSVPRIAAILAVKNGADYLGEAVRSILRQTMGDFELVIVDNGSTDETAEILSGFARQDKRIRLLFLPDPGLSDCLRLGIANSAAPYLARLDADDLARPDRFALQMERLEADHGLGLMGSQVTMIDNRSRPLARLTRPTHDPEIRRLMSRLVPFCHSSVMMKREVYERAGGYRPGIRYGEDWDLWLRMAPLTRMANHEEALVSYRVHGDSISQRYAVRFSIAQLRLRAASLQAQQELGSPDGFPARPLMRESFGLVRTSREQFVREIKTHVFKQALKRLLFVLGAMPIVSRAFPRLFHASP